MPGGLTSVRRCKPEMGLKMYGALSVRRRTGRGRQPLAYGRCAGLRALAFEHFLQRLLWYAHFNTSAFFL